MRCRESGCQGSKKTKGRKMKKHNRNSRSRPRSTEVVGGNTILFHHANRNVRDHDVNYPIFFSTRRRTWRSDGLLINLEAVIRFCYRPAKNVVAHSITVLADCQSPRLPIDLDGSSYLSLLSSLRLMQSRRSANKYCDRVSIRISFAMHVRITFQLFSLPFGIFLSRPSLCQKLAHARVTVLF